MKSNELKEHVFLTYYNLRIGIAIMGIVFPVCLAVSGYIKGIPLQDSISAYYHAGGDHHFYRTFFVGLLFAIGVCLCLYKGFTNWENYALNMAGIFAIGVALFPMSWSGPEGDFTEYKFFGLVSAHYLSAVLLFLCIAYVCIWQAPFTLSLIKEEQKRKRYKNIYWALGAGMILSPIIALLFAFVIQGMQKYTFIVETVGILIFASYWLIKSKEIKETNADEAAVMGQF